MKSKNVRRSSEGDKNSVFNTVTQKAGLSLTDGVVSNVLGVSPAAFIRSLSASFKGQKRATADIVQDYMNGLQKFLQNADKLQQCLLPTDMESEKCHSATSGKQDSLIRLLMKVDFIQTELMLLLLDKLVECAEGQEYSEVEDFDMVHFILEQFRFLDRIVDSKGVAEKMLEIVSFASLNVQREIISCIPEIVADADHTETGKKLRDIFIENNRLIGPVLDALANMTLQPKVLKEIRDSVLQTLPSAEADCLPVIVRFLLQSAANTDAITVVSQMRLYLDFDASMKVRQPSGGKKSRESRSSEKQGSAMLTLEAIKSGIQFRKTVAEAFIKAIEKVHTAEKHTVMDILVLLLLHGTSYRKQVEGLVRNKLRAEQLQSVLLQKAFSTMPELLEELFQSVLNLASVLLRSPECVISDFGCTMYKLAFSEFSAYCRQEIVCDLLAHISSGSPGEVQGSLSILEELVTKERVRMGSYASLLMGVLDYLETLSLVQVKQVYFMLATLAYRCPPDGDVLRSDLMILIRKQLANASPKYKKMGAVGTVMVIRCIGCSNDTPLTDADYEVAVGLLKLLRSSSKTADTLGLFMDELSSLVLSGSLHPKLGTWISENVITDFQDDFVVDLDKSMIGKTKGLPLDAGLGIDSIDDENDGAIAINLLPLLAKEKKMQQADKKADVPSRVFVQCLAPHFRLLQVCESQQNQGDLGGIDALLGCPVYMPSQDLVEKMSSMSTNEKVLMCDSLFYLLNWFRELLNAFANQDDNEMKAKVLLRLCHITQVEKLLETCLAGISGYTPPLAQFDHDGVSLKPVSLPERKRKRPSNAKGKKKQKMDDDAGSDAEDETQTTQEGEKSPDCGKVKENNNNTISGKFEAKSFLPYMRNIDMTVYQVLTYGPLTQKATNSESKSQDSGSTELQHVQGEQLYFLLQNLALTLNEATSGGTKKSRGFPGKSQSRMTAAEAGKTVLETVNLLPALCDHLNKTHNYFQSQMDANDGLIDGPNINTQEMAVRRACYESLLQILHLILTWPGFTRLENRGLQKKMLAAVASSTDSSLHTQSGLAELYKSSFAYFEKFVENLPCFSSAVAMCTLLHNLAEKAESAKLIAETGIVAQKVLKTEWTDNKGEMLRGKEYNEQLQSLFKLACQCSPDVLAMLEDIVNAGVSEILNKENDRSTAYPTLTKYSFSVFYRGMFSALVSFVRQVAVSSIAAVDNEEKLERLVQWNMAVRIFHMLVNLIKVYDARSNLGTALKSGRQFVELFLSQGMPLVDTLVKHYREDINSLLKNLQLTTRALHHICGHSKIIKDVTLTNQVPLMKKCLEAFVYRVKAMLTRNGCLEAFWLGNLKNRDLQGEEILSQASSRASSQATQEDSGSDSMPSDDSDAEQADGASVTRTGQEGEETYEESLSEAF